MGRKKKKKKWKNYEKPWWEGPDQDTIYKVERACYRVGIRLRTIQLKRPDDFWYFSCRWTDQLLMTYDFPSRTYRVQVKPWEEDEMAAYGVSTRQGSGCMEAVGLAKKILDAIQKPLADR